MFPFTTFVSVTEVLVPEVGTVVQVPERDGATWSRYPVMGADVLTSLGGFQLIVFCETPGEAVNDAGGLDAP